MKAESWSLEHLGLYSQASNRNPCRAEFQDADSLQRLRQLGDIRRDPPRLVFPEQLGCRSEDRERIDGWRLAEVPRTLGVLGHGVAERHLGEAQELRLYQL